MSITLSSQEKLDLKRLLSSNECDDNTEYIRKFKHSIKMKNDLNHFTALKQSFCDKLPIYLSKYNPDELKCVQENFIIIAKQECSFLNTVYPDIFIKILKDELDIPLFQRLLDVLKQIEDNVTDQHEASVTVGKILKEIYIDSALRHGNHLDEIYNNSKDNDEIKKEIVIEKTITWEEYKNNKK